MKTAITILTSCFLLVLGPVEGFLASAEAVSRAQERPFSDIFVPSRVAECVVKLSPTMGEMHALALKYARMSPADISRWKKNIKWSALLPRLQFDYQRRIVDGVNVDIDDSVSVTSSGVTVGPTASGWSQNMDRNNNIEIKAIWYLDELLFNREDLSISSEARSQISARRDLLGNITEDYFELKRLISIYLTKSQEAVEARGRIILEIDRLTGDLDALTGGWFSPRFKWKEVGCE